MSNGDKSVGIPYMPLALASRTDIKLGGSAAKGATLRAEPLRSNSWLRDRCGTGREMIGLPGRLRANYTRCQKMRRSIQPIRELNLRC
jgi:hypothetical protein